MMKDETSISSFGRPSHRATFHEPPGNHFHCRDDLINPATYDYVVCTYYVQQPIHEVIGMLIIHILSHSPGKAES